MNEQIFYCPICNRLIPDDCIERHHLIPKSRKGRKIVLICCDCHDMIHELFTNKQLANQYNTIEYIKDTEKIKKWINWIKNKPFRYKITMAKKKRKR